MEYPPGPSQLLPNQIITKFTRKPIETLLEFSKKYGDICHFGVGKSGHAYLLFNPDHIENVLVNNPDNFLKTRVLQVSKKVLGEGLVTSDGEYHHRQRKLILPNFYPKQIQEYSQTMVDSCQNMTKEWKSGQVIDAQKEMTKVALSIICRTTLASNIDHETEEKVGKALPILQDYVIRRLMPFGELLEKLSFLPLPKKFHHAMNTMNGIVYGMINERRKSGAYGKDLISRLLLARDDNNTPMTDIQLRDQVFTIFLAGHETTSTALTWTFYLLSQNPEIEETLYREVKSVLGDAFPTAQDIPKLQYAEKVIRESLRIYPPVWTISRQAINDHSLGKYTIPSGSLVIMSQYVMHHNEKYFEEPERFNPDRWTENFIRSMPRFCYFPFGGGIRSCVGESFSWMEGVLLLCMIVRSWKMVHVPQHKVVLNPRVTLTPKYGMKMKLKKR